MCKDFDLIMRDRCYKDAEKIIGDSSVITTNTANTILESFDPFLSHKRAPIKERPEANGKEKVTFTPSQLRYLNRFM